MKMINIYITLFILFMCCHQAVSQCAEDRHTTNIMDGWMSCETSMNPQSGLGDSHWIKYDLGYLYSLHAVKLWNISHPTFITSGVKEAVFSSSLDGVSWNTIGTFTIPKGHYTSKYEGVMSVDLNGVQARHLMITALSNHGGACVGFSEIKVHLQEIQLNELVLDLKLCENGGAYSNINPGINLEGRFSGPGVTDNGDDSFNFDPDLLGPGTYTVRYKAGSTILRDQITVLGCGHVECPDCDYCGGTDQSVLNSADIPSGKYIDTQIASLGQIQSNREVDFRASQQLILDSDFEVNSNSEFTAQIRECYLNFTQNPSFENGWANWERFNLDDALYTVNFVIDTEEAYEGNQCAAVEVVDTNPASYRVRLRQSEMPLEAFKKYKALVRAKSEDAAKFDFRIQSVYPNSVYIKDGSIAHTPYWTTHEIEFSSDQELTTNSFFEVWLGSYPGTHLFDNIKIIEVE